MSKEKIKHYGKYVGAGAAGVALGVGGATVADDEASQTQVDQLKEEVDTLEAEKSSLDAQVDSLQSTVDSKEQKVSDLKADIEELTEAKGELEDELSAATERTHFFDYYPTFDSEDLEVNEVKDVERDSEHSNFEGEYDGATVVYTDEESSASYEVRVLQFEYEEDAEDAYDDKEDDRDADSYRTAFRDGNTVVTVDGDKDGSSGSVDEPRFERQYEDFVAQYE